MRAYVLPVTLEPDENVWRAYVPALESRGAATWGHTRDEALQNIQQVVQMVVEEMLEEGESLPASIQMAEQPTVAVNISD